MRIALIGYGKMGRTIRVLGEKQGFSFPLIIEEKNRGQLNDEGVKDIDVAIEFTTPDAAPENIMRCFDLGIPVVSGSTGWNQAIEEVEQYCMDKGASLFHASNFSIGVNILFAMNRKLASIMEQFPQYRSSISEVHHTQKLDAPSGTAISLAEQIIGENSRIKGWFLEESGDAKGEQGNQLPITAIREGEVKGRHHISYASETDRLTLGHDALTRDAFASGALTAAVFLLGKTGIFGMNDLLNL